jgi:hypothetical protein
MEFLFLCQNKSAILKGQNPPMRRNFSILLNGLILIVAIPLDHAFSSPMETRILKCQTVEPTITAQTPLPSGIEKTSILFSDNGFGNVESIQLGLQNSGEPATFYDSLIDIRVDGQLIVSVPVGLLFNYYDLGGNSIVTYLSKNVSLSYDTGSRDWSMGGFRRIFIPYQTSCTISLRNQGKGSPQVLYRDGGAPDPEIYGANRIKFHAFCIPFAGGAPSKAYDTITAIPLTKGKGELDSIQLYAGKARNLTFLEGDPSIILDGNPLTYGGTEDFLESNIMVWDCPMERDDVRKNGGCQQWRIPTCMRHRLIGFLVTAVLLTPLFV